MTTLHRPKFTVGNQPLTSKLRNNFSRDQLTHNAQK